MLMCRMVYIEFFNGNSLVYNEHDFQLVLAATHSGLVRKIRWTPAEGKH